jgi:hypothetical protein
MLCLIPRCFLLIGEHMADEHFLDKGVSMRYLLGCEGFWGLIITSLAIPLANVLPGPSSAPGGRLESLSDTFYLLEHSPQVVILLFLLLFVSLSCDLSSLFVIKYAATTTQKEFFKVLRPFVVLCFGIILYYVIPSLFEFGEPFSLETIVRMLGLIVIWVGLMTYYKGCWGCAPEEQPYEVCCSFVSVCSLISFSYFFVSVFFFIFFLFTFLFLLLLLPLSSCFLLF